MKIEKFLLFLPASLQMASKRMDIPTITPHQLTILYLLKSLPSARCSTLSELLKAAGQKGQYPHTYNTLKTLESYSLVESLNNLYSLTHKGRDYLSYVRRYLLHKRL